MSTKLCTTKYDLYNYNFFDDNNLVKYPAKSKECDCFSKWLSDLQVAIDKASHGTCELHIKIGGNNWKPGAPLDAFTNSENVHITLSSKINSVSKDVLNILGSRYDPIPYQMFVIKLTHNIVDFFKSGGSRKVPHWTIEETDVYNLDTYWVRQFKKSVSSQKKPRNTVMSTTRRDKVIKKAVEFIKFIGDQNYSRIASKFAAHCEERARYSLSEYQRTLTDSFECSAVSVKNTMVLCEAVLDIKDKLGLGKNDSCNFTSSLLREIETKSLPKYAKYKKQSNCLVNIHLIFKLPEESDNFEFGAYALISKMGLNWSATSTKIDDKYITFLKDVFCPGLQGKFSSEDSEIINADESVRFYSDIDSMSTNVNSLVSLLAMTRSESDHVVTMEGVGFWHPSSDTYLLTERVVR